MRRPCYTGAVLLTVMNNGGMLLGGHLHLARTNERTSQQRKALKYMHFDFDLMQRLETNNSGGSKFTRPYRSWELVVFLGFKDKLKATAFEKYLKSGSGSSFAKKRFW